MPKVVGIDKLISKARTLILTSLLLCGCHSPDSDHRSSVEDGFKLLSTQPSPDGHWESLVGTQNYAGGFGTGSLVKSVYVKRLLRLSKPVKVMEISEDENGDNIRIEASWSSAKELSIHYSGGIVDIQVIRYGGLYINASREDVNIKNGRD